ncbi:MAG: hypothetical protein LBG19_04555 [Prevotellaceae bacterium]|jgi:hypothetical protein|nr:hypothetical protein [Prevotellaceae bacterium]
MEGYKEIWLDDLDEFFIDRKEFYIYNDYERIGYRCFYDPDVGKYRYIARMGGREFEVYKETSNVLWDTMNQSFLIDRERYLRI